IDGEQHVIDVVVRIAADKTDGVPRLRSAWVVPLLEHGSELSQAGHGNDATGRIFLINGVARRLAHLSQAAACRVADIPVHADRIRRNRAGWTALRYLVGRAPRPAPGAQRRLWRTGSRTRAMVDTSHRVRVCPATVGLHCRAVGIRDPRRLCGMAFGY